MSSPFLNASLFTAPDPGSFLLSSLMFSAWLSEGISVCLPAPGDTLPLAQDAPASATVAGSVLLAAVPGTAALGMGRLRLQRAGSCGHTLICK